ncbi:phage protein [Streptococcus pneumoniae]|nr:phage protein [Streptococcus pneumoniae]
MNNKQVYQAQTTDHGIARALGEEIRIITDVEETTYNGHGEIIVEYTSDVALTKLFDRIKALYEKGESYETKPFLHFKVLEDDIEPSPNGVFTAKEVAECAEVKHRHLKILLNKHREDFESFGKVQFKISPSESGQNVRDYILNEQQATLLITYLRNTEPVRKFKMNLVKAFFEMREELSKFRMQRALEKPKRKTLHDSIENWEQAPKHAHSTMNNLLLKAVTDRNAKQLREERGGYNGIDSLTSDELEQYQAFEDMVIAMMGLNMSYQEIKAMAFRNKKTRQRSA